MSIHKVATGSSSLCSPVQLEHLSLDETIFRAVTMTNIGQRSGFCMLWLSSHTHRVCAAADADTRITETKIHTIGCRDCAAREQ
jgi:hypothetical protein